MKIISYLVKLIKIKKIIKLMNLCRRKFLKEKERYKNIIKQRYQNSIRKTKRNYQ